jgi:hypothetical protein
MDLCEAWAALNRQRDRRHSMSITSTENPETTLSFFKTGDLEPANLEACLNNL